MTLSKLRDLATTPAHNRRKASRIAFHASLKHVLPRRGRSGARHDYLLQRDDIGIRLADGHDNSAQVGMLVTRMYRSRGYLIPAAEASPSDWIRRVTLEACYKNRTVGTLTVNLGAREGLQAEALYGDEIVQFRHAGARPCEFTRLALDAEECSKEALACLFHLGYIFAYRIHRASDVFVEVNPRHSLFYRRMLGFDQVGAQKTCPRVNAPAILLHKRLDAIAADLARLGGQRAANNKSFYALGLSPAEENDLVQTINAMLAQSGAAAESRNNASKMDTAAIAGLAHSA
jgi:hypothetical protein